MVTFFVILVATSWYSQPFCGKDFPRDSISLFKQRWGSKVYEYPLSFRMLSFGIKPPEFCGISKIHGIQLSFLGDRILAEPFLIKQRAKSCHFSAIMRARWTEAEDDQLRELVKTHGRQWSVIASYIPTRTAAQASARWEKCINPDLVKGNFTPEEDAILAQFVQTNGIHAWPKVPQVLPRRSPKQCRERWFNNLDPSVSKTPWTPEEDRLIFDLHLQHGPKWALIAPLVQGRTDNAIKNRWNASISHRLDRDPAGNPILAPSKARSYTRRKPLDSRRPPELAVPSAIRFMDSDSPTVLTMTPMTFGVASPRSGENMGDAEFGFHALGIDSPFADPRKRSPSPGGFDTEFLFRKTG
jgi:hypothetical protein